jgi:hypothetical protein
MEVSFLCVCSYNRLFGFGIGIHLLQSETPESMPKKTEINPKDNHISFQVIFFLQALFSGFFFFFFLDGNAETEKYIYTLCLRKIFIFGLEYFVCEIFFLRGLRVILFLFYLDF